MKINIDDYRNFSITDIQLGIQKNIFTLADIIEVCIATHNEFENKVCAWEEFICEDIENIIKNSQEIFSTNSNLHGVPFGVKDVINTSNFKTQMGSLIWKDHKAGNNARIVSRLLNAQAIIVGKTVSSEFAVDSNNKTKNPWDIKKIPGTSSSGSAASVSCGMVPFALGTQTLGSIIRPASWCGIYGMKPTYGLIPRTGVLKTTDTLDTMGFFTRSNDDLKKILNETVLCDDNHPIIQSNIDNSKKNFSKIKVDYMKLGNSKNETILNDFLSKVKNQIKCEMKEVKLPDEFSSSYETHQHIYNLGLSYYFQDEIRNNYNDLSAPFRKRIQNATKYKPEDYSLAFKNQEKLTKSIESFFSNIDIDFIICLSSSGSAPVREQDKHDDYNYLWTMAYLPVINVPHLFDENNMPIGFSIVGKKYSDFQILNFINVLINKGLLQEKCLIPKLLSEV